MVVLPGPARRPTLSDVARLARVSIATASRALSNPAMVSEASRAAVAAAVESAGYRPNLLARSLRTQSARAIVVLVPGLENPFYPEIIRGLEGAARHRGYSLMLGLTLHDEAVEMSYLQMVHNQRADGLMILDGGLKHVLRAGRDIGVPTVQVVERLRGADLPWVGIDDRAASCKATRHLIDLGHKRIGHLSGLARYYVTPERIAGYRAALKAAGLGYDAELVEPGDFTSPGGEAAAQKLMALANPPTALFCGNDDSALGALRYLRGAGIRVPQDVSIVGIDDTHLASSTEPPLTTLRQPRYEIGIVAMTMLLDIISGKNPRPADQTLPVDMILRESTAPARGR